MLPDTSPAKSGAVPLPVVHRTPSTAVVTTGQSSGPTSAWYDPSSSELYYPSQYLLSITHSILSILETNVYRRTLATCITREQRVRLEALRRQVWFGDAPLTPEEEQQQQQQRQREALSTNPTTGTEVGKHSTNAPGHPGSLLPPGAVVPGKREGALADPRATTTTTAHLLKPPQRWYDFSARLEWNAWVRLRGKFPVIPPSAPVSPSFFNQRSAAETLCHEFLDLVEQHKHHPRVGCQLMPLVHAAQSRAYFQMLCERNRLHVKTKTTSTNAINAAGDAVNKLFARTFLPVPTPSLSQRVIATATLPIVFHIKAWQFDPAAVALLWVCRTFGLPATFQFIPLPSNHNDASGEGGVCPLNESQIPFLATLAVAASPESSFEVRSPVAAFSLLADHLLAPYPYLAGESQLGWVSRNNNTNNNANKKTSICPTSPDGRSLGQKSKERARWMDELTQITTLLRTPLLQLLVDGKVAEEVRLYETSTTTAKANPNVASGAAPSNGEAKGKIDAKKKETAKDGVEASNASTAQTPSTKRYADLNTRLQRRTTLLRETAAKLHCLESYFVEQAENFLHHHKSNNRSNNNKKEEENNSNNKVKKENSEKAKDAKNNSPPYGSGTAALWRLLSPSLTPFPAAQRRAAVKQLTAYWKVTSHRPVTLVDVYLATCGYILATHPYCADIYPLDIEGSTMALPSWREAANPNPTAAQGVAAVPADKAVDEAAAEAAATLAAVSASGAVASTSAAGSLLRIPRLYKVKSRISREGILQVLQLEERFARLHRQLPLRFHTLAAPCSPSTPTSDAAGAGAGASGSSLPPPLARFSSSVVAQLLEARLMTCTEDFTPKPGPPSMWRTPPFAILSHILCRAWKRADGQVPGFPSLLVHVQVEVDRHRPRVSPSSCVNDPEINESRGKAVKMVSASPLGRTSANPPLSPSSSSTAATSISTAAQVVSPAVSRL